MVVPAGILNLNGFVLSSVRNQLPIFTSFVAGLNSSTESDSGGSVCVRISLIKIGAMDGAGSSAPGEPPRATLARQLIPFAGSGFRFGLAGTIENPFPSAVVGHG